jgi:rare lipoprotein A
LAALLALAGVVLAGAAGCAARRPPEGFEGPMEGPASWYGVQYHGRRAADGSRYNMYELTAAHPTLPFGTRVRVTNLANDRRVDVVITDRGPFVEGRIVDLSYAAAQAIGMVGAGVTRVRLEVLD